MPPRYIDRYRILRRIGGRPGCALFEAAVADGASVALKLFALRDTPHMALAEALARFRRESQVVRRLAHPGIVRGLGWGEDASHAWLVLELLRGPGLSTALRGAGNAEKLAGVLRILDALGHLHAQGMVHRDLKPANIVLDMRRGPVLCDLGLVHVGDSLLTQRGDLFGTPAYMAPECFRGEEPDARSDVFSAGVIAYELLAGRLPFDGANSGEIMLAIVQEAPLPASRWNAAVPPELDAALATALAKPRHHRFASAAAFAAALQRVSFAVASAL